MTLKAATIGMFAAGAVAAAPLPALAWEQLDLGTGQAGQPTYAPEAPLRFKDLPGVGLNSSGQTADGRCSESRFRDYGSFGSGESGTMTECNLGRFTFRTYRSGNGGGTGYNPFPVPGPLQQAGPPPGSGGVAPARRW